MQPCRRHFRKESVFVLVVLNEDKLSVRVFGPYDTIEEGNQKAEGLIGSTYGDLSNLKMTVTEVER